MNNVKTNPIGLDAVIHRLQTELYKLKDKWNVVLTGYPRCYILVENDKKTIESFLSDNDYSRSLIFAEDNKFFFIAPSDIQKHSANYYQTELELYFILDVTQCYPNITHRADEEVRNDVLSVLDRISDISVETIVINIDKVFNRYNNRISLNYEYEYTDDMQPYHCFKVILNVLPYDIKKQICN